MKKIILSLAALLLFTTFAVPADDLSGKKLICYSYYSNMKITSKLMGIKFHPTGFDRATVMTEDTYTPFESNWFDYDTSSHYIFLSGKTQLNTDIRYKIDRKTLKLTGVASYSDVRCELTEKLFTVIFYDFFEPLKALNKL